jgi:hypothetical protein
MQMSNLNKFGKLSRGERRLLVQSILLLPVFHIALLLLGYYHLRALIEKIFPFKESSTLPSETAILERAQEIARAVSIAAQHGFYKATCLRRSMLVWLFLQREGIQNEICFGVRVVDSKLAAHAWVEYNGTVINDAANIHEHYPTLQEALPATRLGL